jgi:DNA-binding winged helix-turn-helix (wHTH) protein
MKVQIGRHLIDTQRREIFLDGVPITVSTRNADLLFYLITKDGQVVSKEELFQNVWAGRVVEESALQRAISLTRGLLGDVEHRIIRTLHGRGYMMVLPEGAALDESVRSNKISQAHSEITLLPDTMLDTQVNVLSSAVGTVTSTLPVASAQLPSRGNSKALWLACALLAITALMLWQRTEPDRVVFIDDRIEDSAKITALVGLVSATRQKPVLLRSQLTEAQQQSGLALSATAKGLALIGDGIAIPLPNTLVFTQNNNADVPAAIARLDFYQALAQLRQLANAGKLDGNQLVWLALALSEQGNASAAHIITEWLSSASDNGKKLSPEMACLLADLYLESEVTTQAQVARAKTVGIPCQLALRRANARLGIAQAEMNAPMPKQLILTLRELEFDARWRATRLGPNEALAALKATEESLGKMHWGAAQARLAAQQGRITRRIVDAQQSLLHFERAARIYRREHLDVEADRMDLQVALNKAGRNITPEVFAQASALAERAANQGNQRARYFAQQTLDYQSTIDPQLAINRLPAVVRDLADREEAFEALTKTLIMLRWRQRKDLVPAIALQARNWFKSDLGLAFQVENEIARSAQDVGNDALAAEALKKADLLANLKTINIKPRLYYCQGADTLAQVNDLALARDWINKCYMEEMSETASCLRHFALYTSIRIANPADRYQLADRTELFLQHLKSGTVNVNCLIAGSAAGAEYFRSDQNVQAQRLIKSLQTAFPDRANRELQAPWLQLEMMNCISQNNNLCAEEFLRKIILINRPASIAEALDTILKKNCSAFAKAVLSELIRKKESPIYQPLQCLLDHCGNAKVNCFTR